MNSDTREGASRIDGSARVVPEVVGPDVSRTFGIVGCRGAVVSASGIEYPREPVIVHLDIVGGPRAAVLARVKRIATARQQIGRDRPVGFQPEILEQADRVRLVQMIEDGVVDDVELLGISVRRHAVRVVAVLIDGIVDVVVCDRAAGDLNAGRPAIEIAPVNFRVPRVPVDVFDRRYDTRVSWGGPTMQ